MRHTLLNNGKIFAIIAKHSTDFMALCSSEKDQHGKQYAAKKNEMHLHV